MKRRASHQSRRPAGQPSVTPCAALPVGTLFLTKQEMAALLQISLRTLAEMMAAGEIPFLKLRGRLVRFRLEDVQRRLTETVYVCHSAQGAPAATSNATPATKGLRPWSR